MTEKQISFQDLQRKQDLNLFATGVNIFQNHKISKDLKVIGTSIKDQERLHSQILKETQQVTDLTKDLRTIAQDNFDQQKLQTIELQKQTKMQQIQLLEAQIEREKREEKELEEKNANRVKEIIFRLSEMIDECEKNPDPMYRYFSGLSFKELVDQNHISTDIFHNLEDKRFVSETTRKTKDLISDAEMNFTDQNKSDLLRIPKVSSFNEDARRTQYEKDKTDIERDINSENEIQNLQDTQKQLDQAAETKEKLRLVNEELANKKMNGWEIWKLAQNSIGEEAGRYNPKLINIEGLPLIDLDEPDHTEHPGSDKSVFRNWKIIVPAILFACLITFGTEADGGAGIFIISFLSLFIPLAAVSQLIKGAGRVTSDIKEGIGERRKIREQEGRENYTLEGYRHWVLKDVQKILENKSCDIESLTLEIQNIQSKIQEIDTVKREKLSQLKKDFDQEIAGYRDAIKELNERYPYAKVG